MAQVMLQGVGCLGRAARSVDNMLDRIEIVANSKGSEKTVVDANAMRPI